MEDRITLDYGSGGLKTSQFIDSILIPAFQNPILSELGDGAVLDGHNKLIFSTDSFVVSPWRFPGGDIGKLCVCGTVNDLCMAGGIPKYLSLSFILEEGFLFSDLKQIVSSIKKETQTSGVTIVTGDTKVVESGKGDGIYINTSGIGFQHLSLPGKSGIRPNDSVLVSGSVGCHGAAIMMARAGLLQEESPLVSDCQSLHLFLDAIQNAAAPGSIRILRDPTRGGIATTLNEFIEGTSLSIELSSDNIPIDSSVEAACDILGLAPLYCACEGRMLVICDPKSTDSILSAMRTIPGGENSTQIGTVTSDFPGKVLLRTSIGGKRILSKLSGMQLPRIC